MQHALTESLLVTMEEWAAKQPAALPDALEAVERIGLRGRKRSNKTPTKWRIFRLTGPAHQPGQGSPHPPTALYTV